VCEACRSTWVAAAVKLMTRYVQAYPDASVVHGQLRALPRPVLNDVAELALASLSGLLRHLPASAVADSRLRSEENDYPDLGGLALWLAEEIRVADSIGRIEHPPKEKS